MNTNFTKVQFKEYWSRGLRSILLLNIPEKVNMLSFCIKKDPEPFMIRHKSLLMETDIIGFSDLGTGLAFQQSLI